MAQRQRRRPRRRRRSTGRGTFLGLVRRAHTESGNPGTFDRHLPDHRRRARPARPTRCRREMRHRSRGDAVGPELVAERPRRSSGARPATSGRSASAGTCDGAPPRQLLAGGSAPDWGPAPVNPRPARDAAGGDAEKRAATGRAPAETRADSPERTGQSATRPVVRAPSSPARLAAKGLRVWFRCADACTVSATATVDRASARALQLRRGAALCRASRRRPRRGRDRDRDGAARRRLCADGSGGAEAGDGDGAGGRRDRRVRRRMHSTRGWC